MEIHFNEMKWISMNGFEIIKDYDKIYEGSPKSTRLDTRIKKMLTESKKLQIDEEGGLIKVDSHQ